MDVAVVIPTHERADLVVRAVESAVAQTAPPSQVIVVDDAADEATVNAVRELVQQHPAVSYLSAPAGEHGGASASRNAGAAACAEGLIAFLDDDDWWDPRYLEQAVRAHVESGSDIVLTPSWMLVDGAREEWMHPSPIAFDSFRPGISGSNMLVTRTAFDTVGGFDPEMWVMNDVDFFVRLRETGATATAASERLVFHEGRGTGHLTSPGSRRARGLEHFLSVHRHRMDRRAVRLLKRRIHAARITEESTALERLGHRMGVAWYSGMADVTGTLRRRMEGRRRAH